MKAPKAAPSSPAKAKPTIQKKKAVAKAGSVPAALFKKGKIDKSVVKAHTSMTREKWLKFQEGMDEKWPLPDYMEGQKGHTKFKDETFEIITRWTTNTRIEYRPHAKAPGSKSHLRYEKYSKAKTVGEALKLSSYPIDWCWDYERGFIKICEGAELRDEPLDIAKAEEEVTEVDMAINIWYTKELAKELNMKPEELRKSAGHAESVHHRAKRLMAQREACSILEACDKEGRAVRDEEILSILKRWPFCRNYTRKNVLPGDRTWVFSDTLGLLRDRCGDLHLTVATRRYPQVPELMNRWLQDRIPKEAKGFVWTTINVNCNYAAAVHRDQGNFGPSFIKAFGDFTGGELDYWPEDAGGNLEKLSAKDKVTINLKENLALFNGNCAHSVHDFTGSRFSIVFFTVGSHAAATNEDKDKMSKLGFNVPAKNADPFIALKPPKALIKKEPTRWGAKAKLPGYISFSSNKVSVIKRGKKSAAEAKKLAQSRVVPEEQRTFYSAKDRALLKAQAKKMKKEA